MFRVVFRFRLIGPNLIPRLAHVDFFIIDQGALQQYTLTIETFTAKVSPISYPRFLQTTILIAQLPFL